MPLDPILMTETRAWVKKAEADLRAAHHDLSAIPPLFADAVFHCQQAVEKMRKAFLLWRGVPFRKTHSLEDLGEQCLDLDETLREFIDRAVPLTEYAWKFRYPGDPEEPSPEEAEEAIRTAASVVQAITSRLAQDVHQSPQE